MEAKLNNPLHVVSYALNIHVQYMPCFIVKEGDHHEEHTKSKADLAQPADSNFKTSVKEAWWFWHNIINITQADQASLVVCKGFLR